MENLSHTVWIFQNPAEKHIAKNILNELGFNIEVEDNADCLLISIDNSNQYASSPRREIRNYKWQNISYLKDLASKLRFTSGQSDFNYEQFDEEKFKQFVGYSNVDELNIERIEGLISGKIRDWYKLWDKYDGFGQQPETLRQLAVELNKNYIVTIKSR